LILAGTFASLLLAKISLLSQMGSAIAIGVSLSAFVIAPIFVPSVSALLGKIVWWPGHRGSISKD
jgi:RND superfamily putative drug exporter